jgi:uncharacterized protein (TIGR02246 family)
MKAPLVLVMAAALSVSGHTDADEREVHKLPKTFAEAMTKHDPHELANIMSGDVDFVTVGAMWLHGRPDFEKYHARLLSGRFSELTLTALQIAIRFLRPDMAIVHWSWRITGDRNIDGTKRQPRYGMMTMVAEKRRGAWFVVTAQNDNSIPGAPPEAEGIANPIPIPGPNQKR